MSDTAAAAKLTYSVAARTDKGMQRSGNEDAFGLFEIPGVETAFVVADGMGGLAAGDIAANEAVSVIEKTLREGLTETSDIQTVVADAFKRANDNVYGMAERYRADNGLNNPDPPTQRRDNGPSKPPGALMGTTSVVGVVRGDIFYLAHAGDSRAYRLRNGELTPLTEDHSFVAERVRAGDMTPAEARVSRFRNMITRAVGIDSVINPEFAAERMLPGDTIMVCSDGLTTMLDDDEIEQILNGSIARSSPDKACAILIEAANKRNSSDNVTVLILRALGEGEDVPAAAPTSPTTRKSTAATSPKAETRSMPSSSKGSVVDLDAKKSRRRSSDGASPLVKTLATLGAIALLIAIVLASSPELRKKFAKKLAQVGQPAPPPGLGPAQVRPLKDYRKLTYDPPVEYGKMLARGDLLAYSARSGLYFVRPGTGQIMTLPVGGKEVKNTGIELEIGPPTPDPAPKSRVFVATDLQGNLYLSYTLRKVIEKRDKDGKLLTTLSGLDRPEAITVDEQGNIYVVDYDAVKILRAQDAKASPSPSATPTKP